MRAPRTEVERRGIRYCGFCGRPMKSKGHKARLCELARQEAAPGMGYPDPAQEPLKLVNGFTSNPSKLFLRYLSGPGEWERMRRSLARYDSRYADVLTASMDNGERLTDVAVRLGITPGHARLIKHRALAWVREYVFAKTYLDYKGGA